MNLAYQGATGSLDNRSIKNIDRVLLMRTSRDRRHEISEVSETLYTKVPEWTALQLQASAMAEKAHSRVPDPLTWGFFAYDDASVLAGGGVGGFLWFRSREEMHEFITHHLAFWYINTAVPDPDCVGIALARALGRFETPEMDADATREEVNQILKGSVQIVWWGRYQELALAESEFGRNVSRWFCSMTNTPGDGGALNKKQQLQLAKIISEYGA